MKPVLQAIFDGIKNGENTAVPQKVQEALNAGIPAAERF